MRVKQQLLEQLERHRGEFCSGAALAQELAVSRNAVCKAASALRAQGYAIDASPALGYRLSENSDLLSRESIAVRLGPQADRYCILVKDQTGSTNSDLKAMAEEGAPALCVVVADSQTDARGRFARGFFAPSGSGLYVSLLLRPEGTAEEASMFTLAAAVAAAQALEELTGETIVIKWVNDLYCRGRKVAGILTEASVDLESGMLRYAVVGIGINLYEPAGGFPPELQQVAGAVLQAPKKGVDRSTLCAKWLLKMEQFVSQGPASYISEYRARSMLLGKTITFTDSAGAHQAEAVAIDDKGHLMVRFADGKERRLLGGEVSLSSYREENA